LGALELSLGILGPKGAPLVLVIAQEFRVQEAFLLSLSRAERPGIVPCCSFITFYRHILCPISATACSDGAKAVHRKHTTTPTTSKKLWNGCATQPHPDAHRPSMAIPKIKKKRLTHLEEAGIMRFSTPFSACFGATTGGFHPGASSGTSLVASAGLGGAFSGRGGSGGSAFGF